MSASGSAVAAVVVVAIAVVAVVAVVAVTVEPVAVMQGPAAMMLMAMQGPTAVMLVANMAGRVVGPVTGLCYGGNRQCRNGCECHQCLG